MKHHHLITAAAATTLLLSGTAAYAADDDVPSRLQFARYEPMMERSPFAVATAPAATPPPAPNFAKDWFVANAARSPHGDLVTVASSTDKNFKEYLTTAAPVNGISISNIEWSDKVGATKVTITKDGQFATLTFNQALLSQPIASAATPQQQTPPQPAPAGVPQMPGSVPNPAGQVPNTGMIKPAPIPQLPTPPPRVRSVIQRNPGAQPVPTPDAEKD